MNKFLSKLVLIWPGFSPPSGGRGHHLHDSKKDVSLLMLIILLMSFGTYGFNSKWLAHELDHDRQPLGVLADHDHASRLDTQGDPDPEPASDIEHLLLHAAGQFQPFPTGPIVDGLSESPARTPPMLSCLRALPTIEPDPPFRPPRITSPSNSA